ncbi:MAG: hypothetical protein N2109_07145 [Fimbriimonadales bacterium]|nr:hypothetical protein [Fimbriimonadales bacterium]
MSDGDVRAMAREEAAAWLAIREVDPDLYGVLMAHGRALMARPEGGFDEVPVAGDAVERFVQAARFTVCSRCGSSVLLLPSLRLVSWPLEGEHQCREMVGVRAPNREAAAAGRGLEV